MKILDWLRRSRNAAPQASAGAAEFFGFDDPRFLEWVRNGGDAGVGVQEALRNTAVFRCVALISHAIAMLPIHLMDRATKEKQRNHPLWELLQSQPNNWQTPFNFRQLMQRRALICGNAYALIVRSGGKPIRLVPLDPGAITPRQRDDWSVEYVYNPDKGRRGEIILQPGEVLHLYGDSDDGIEGVSLVKRAADAIRLASDAELAARRLYRNGAMIGGYLKHQNKLSPEAHARLKANMDERTGAENAGKWLILEEGMEAQVFDKTLRDSQHNELRARQVEEIARVFGVPRPLLMVDETSWGSGVAELARIFVDYGLAPWGVAWGQAIERSLLGDRERERLMVRFNFGALLQGSVADQAEYFAKALGSGGHPAWMTQDEVRDLANLGPVREGDRLNPGANPAIQERDDVA